MKEKIKAPAMCGFDYSMKMLKIKIGIGLLIIIVGGYFILK